MEDFAAFDDFPVVPETPIETASNTQYYVDEEEVQHFIELVDFLIVFLTFASQSLPERIHRLSSVHRRWNRAVLA